MNRACCTIIFLLIVSAKLQSQTIYADAVNGNDNAAGSLQQPLASLEKAVNMANSFAGKEKVRIIIAPGIYLLKQQLKIHQKNSLDTNRYTLEALIMPDDSTWLPYKMPVIESISANNDSKYFDHCAGLMIERENVAVKGLKFTGNGNPLVDYYYPIEKDTELLKNLYISQCYFIGEKNGTPIQGGIYVEGQGVHVDHCIFYGCKNDVLIFQNTRGFSLTHNIFYGAYECAIWYSYDKPDDSFIFSDNVVSHCSYFWASSKGFNHSSYTFNHSLISENANYVGMQNGHGGVTTLTQKESYTENDIRKEGKLLLFEVETEGLPKNYLNIVPNSDASYLDAGIFTVKKK